MTLAKLCRNIFKIFMDLTEKAMGADPTNITNNHNNLITH